jgi:hypothetical protein
MVGLWMYEWEAGMPAYVELTPDGRHLFRLPLATHRGRYRLQARTLTIQWDGGEAIPRSVQLVDDTLLMGDEPDVNRYRREHRSIPPAVPLVER